jgi:acyl dehydratase
MMMAPRRYFEDFPVGPSVEVGRHTVSEAEILEFARKYDPQPFHTDVDAARESLYGGLIASGFHTCSLMMSMLARNQLAGAAGMGSPGIDNLRWYAPLRPGDILRMTHQVMEARVSASRPDRGILKTHWEGFNQHDEKLVSLDTTLLMGRRPSAG